MLRRKAVSIRSREQEGNTRTMEAYVDRDEPLRGRSGAADELPEGVVRGPDDMIEASPSLWGNEHHQRATERAPRPHQVFEPEPEPTLYELEAPAPRRRGTLKWIAIGGLMALGGAGLAFGLSALKGGSQPITAPAPIAVASHDEPDDQANEAATEDGDRAAPRDEEHASTNHDSGAHEGAAKPAEAPAATVAAQPAAKAPAPPPAWVAAVEASNPWQAISGATTDRPLGVTSEMLRMTYADRITGLSPERHVLAPRSPYQLQQHEVSWGELEAASGSVGGLSSLVMPAWVPKAAARRASLPATGIPWTMARAFCRTMGGELPTEAEWEWAARGPDDNYFPWGREALDANKVRIFARRPIPVAAVGTSSQDVSAFGVHDLLGNAQEWTRDVWAPSRAGAGGEALKLRVVRGWPLTNHGSDVPSEGSTFRQGECADVTCEPSASLARIGFRCMKAVPTP